MRQLCFLLLLFFNSQFLFAKPYDIVIRGGRVIDPKNNLNTVLDVAISNGKVVRVAKAIDATHAVEVIDASGMYVVPGLVDF